jgi:hypothetical protein
VPSITEVASKKVEKSGALSQIGRFKGVAEWTIEG